MSEAEMTTSTPCTNAEVEPLVYDLCGAASIAALVLEAIRERGGDPMSQSYIEGLGWLETHLGAAAENLLAVHENREPNWLTMCEADRIREALARAAKRGEERAAARTNLRPAA